MAISVEMAKRIAAATASKTGNIIKDGEYLFEVQNILMETKRQKELFIVELKVLASKKTSDKEPNPVGSTASYIVNMGFESSDGNVKSFLAVMCGKAPEDLTVEEIIEACSAAQPFRFFKIRDEAFSKPQKNKPEKMFTYHRWEAVPTRDSGPQAGDGEINSLVDIFQRRKAADAAKADAIKK